MLKLEFEEVIKPKTIPNEIPLCDYCKKQITKKAYSYKAKGTKEEINSLNFLLETDWLNIFRFCSKTCVNLVILQLTLNSNT